MEELLLLALVALMGRKRSAPSIAELGFVDVDGKPFDVDPTLDAQLLELEPVTRGLIAQLLARARAEGMQVRIVEKTGASRTRPQQAAEKAEGDSLSDDGPHVYGAGVDLRFLGAKPWDPAHPWARLGGIGRELGLVWGGDWKRLKDLGHFERRDWRSLRSVA